MNHRRATLDDVPLLAELNHQLIRDEGHRNPMTVMELAFRMRGWIESGEYVAIMFAQGGQVLAYALYCEQPKEIYLRQLFVLRTHRRKGLGREAVRILRRDIWPADRRLTVEVLCRNPAAIAFYRALGYDDYSLAMEIMPSNWKG